MQKYFSLAMQTKMMLAAMLLSCCGEAADVSKALFFNPGNQTFYLSMMRYGTSAHTNWSSKAYPEWHSTDTLTLTGKLVKLSERDSLCRMQFTFSTLQFLHALPRAKLVPAKGRISQILDERDSLFYLVPGMSIILTFNKYGEVEQVEGMEELSDSLAAIEKVAAYSVRSMLHDYLSEEALKDIFNQVFFNLPAKQVYTEDKWSNDFILTTKAPVKYSNLFTLKKENRDTAFIEMFSMVSATTGEGGKTYLKGKQSGTSKTNIKTGLPFEIQTVMESTTTMDSSALLRREKLTVLISSKE